MCANIENGYYSTTVNYGESQDKLYPRFTLQDMRVVRVQRHEECAEGQQKKMDHDSVRYARVREYFWHCSFF